MEATPLLYELADVSLPHAVHSRAVAVNNAGRVLAHALGREGRPVTYLWSNDAFSVIDTRDVPWRAGRLTPVALNDREQVLFNVEVPRDRASARPDFPAVGTGSRAALWDAGTWTDLGIAGVAKVLATGLNDQGQVVGQMWTPPADQAFIWEGALRCLGSLGDGTYWSWAEDINTVGEIAGYSDSPRSDGSYQAVVWRDGSILNLGEFSDSPSQAVALNDQGQVLVLAGWPRTAQQLYLWRAGCLDAVSHQPMRELAERWRLNDLGIAVGSGALAERGEPRPSRPPEALVFREGQVYRLADLLIGGSGWTLATALDVNDHGQVVGQGRHGRDERAYLLTPVDRCA